MAVAAPCWSDLPPDILFFISKRIAAPNDISDVLRFRSVCASWRSSCPSPTPRLPLFSNYELSTLKLDADSALSHIFYVHTRSLFLVKSLLDHRSWLVKSDHAACSSSDGRRRRPMKLYCPLSGSRRHYLRNSKLVLDFSKFQVIELGQEHIGVLKSYWDEDLLKIHKPAPLNKCWLRPNRVALIPTSDHHFIFFARCCLGVLVFLRSGSDTDWTSVLGNNSTYDALDLASFKGRFYAVDSDGKTCVVDQSANVTWFSGRASRDLYSRWISRFLVESEGELLLVDVGFCTMDSPERFRFRMFKLNVERSEWDRVQLKLGDNRVLFLGEDGSFSVSASQLGWRRGNFIFFGIGSSTYVYDLERGEVTSLDHGPNYYGHPNHLNLLLSPPLGWFQESHKNGTFMRRFTTTCTRVLGTTFFVLGLAITTLINFFQ